jgi:hypothetical protein
MPNASQQPDLLWSAIDWAVRGAGAILLLVLSFGWKDYRDKIEKINSLDREVEVLKAEIVNLKEWIRGQAK